MKAQLSDAWRKRGRIMKKTKKILAITVSWLLILFMAAPAGVFAQEQAAPQKFSEAELDQMLAPIALYPDSLLAQVLIASTYPLEVVMAEHWVNENKGLQGDHGCKRACCLSASKERADRELRLIYLGLSFVL